MWQLSANERHIKSVFRQRLTNALHPAVVRDVIRNGEDD